jgi:hypothetical protein
MPNVLSQIESRLTLVGFLHPSSEILFSSWVKTIPLNGIGFFTFNGSLRSS